MKLLLTGAAALLLWMAVLGESLAVWDEEAAVRSEVDRCLYAGGSLVECGGQP